VSAYTTRILLVNGQSGDVSYVVPAGKRAVLMDAGWAQIAGQPTYVALKCQGIWQWVGEIVATPPSAQHWSGRIVAYAGETLGWWAGLACSGYLTAYLFDDP
jgi:hypothetical protein